MIPKIIHYCWFGHNPLPPLALKCIASWKKYLPDYEIKEWNEENFDVNIIPYTREAYAAGKYAFVTDYARFWILYKYGGIYFDTDVEMIRPIDDIIAAGGFMGYETDPQPSSVDVCLSGGNETEVSSDLGLGVSPGLGLGVAPGLGLGVAPGLGLVKKVLDYYEGAHFVNESNMRNQITVVHITTHILLENGLQLEPGIQRLDGVNIYPSEYFCPINLTTGRLHITSNTRTIHHYSGSWVHGKFSFKKWIKRVLPENIVLKIIQQKSKRK